jgi:hypothetical protein
MTLRTRQCLHLIASPDMAVSVIPAQVHSVPLVNI